MDQNICGLPTLEGVDHADPASIRALAESVDLQIQQWQHQLHEYRYPDAVCCRPTSDYTFGVLGYDSTFDLGALQFCSWNPNEFDTYRPGIWMFGCTITFVNFTGAGITAIRGIVEASDYRTPSMVTPTTSRYTMDTYRCGRGEENLNVCGLMEFVNPPQGAFVPAVRLWGAGTADMSATRTYFWAVRVGENS